MSSPVRPVSFDDRRAPPSPVVDERVELVVAGADVQGAAAEVRRVAGADADVGQVAVGRQRDAEAHDVEVVADRRTGERVVGEVDAGRRCRSRRRSRRTRSRRGRRGRSASSRPGRRRPTARRRRWCRRRSGCPSCPTRRRCPRSGRSGAALAADGVVGADRGAEGDAAVGLAGHVDAEADAGDRAQVVGGRVAVVVEDQDAPSLLML